MVVDLCPKDDQKKGRFVVPDFLNKSLAREYD
jgi:hypothetical protein